MRTYIALLRGINVSGQKKVKMADLRQMLQRLGFQEVTTYIQSGNIVLKSDETQIGAIENKITQGINDAFGFEVPILVKPKREIQNILENNPFDNAEDIEANSIYFVLLKEMPESSLIEFFNKEKYDSERFAIIDKCVYLCCKNGYGKAKLNNNLIERKLKVSATTRNYRTMTKLLEMSKIE